MSGILQGVIGSGKGKLSLTVSTTQENYDLYAAAVAANYGSAAGLPNIIELTITSSGLLGGFTAGSGWAGSYYYVPLLGGARNNPGLNINSFRTGSIINVHNYGKIYGGPGAGGLGYGCGNGNPPGNPGGHAIVTNGAFTLNIYNYSGAEIRGAGGGGAGAPCDTYCDVRKHGGAGYGYSNTNTSAEGESHGSGQAGTGGGWATAGNGSVCVDVRSYSGGGPGSLVYVSGTTLNWLLSDGATSGSITNA